MAPYGRALIAAVLTASLCGCAQLEQAAPDHRQEDAAAAHDACLAQGFAEGAPEFANCVEAEVALIADRRRRGPNPTEQGSVPATARPDTGRLCLPTAAGPRLGC